MKAAPALPEKITQLDKVYKRKVTVLRACFEVNTDLNFSLNTTFTPEARDWSRPKQTVIAKLVTTMAALPFCLI